MPDTTPAAKKRCSYQSGGWHCPFDAHPPHPNPLQRTGEKADSPSPQGGEGGGEDRPLCIFHLPVEKKKPEDFWRHLASYLVALLEKAGNNETEAWRKAHPDHWVFREADPALIAACARVIPRESEESFAGWQFTGFIFPPMDERHNFENFVFRAADFRGATFSGAADFGVATFNGTASFGGATFNGPADFWGATFSGTAYFGDATFSGPADFGDATFSSEAAFRVATFSGPADFGDATFSSEAAFRVATFNGEADFASATFSSEADFGGATFSGTADFSFARFAEPPSYARTGFKDRVDFYEAKVPGLSKQCDERDARNIRLLAERHGSYADAGDFYRIEMDFRRRRFRNTPGRWFQYVLMELYRLSSRYGESPGRALVSLLVGLLAFSFAFVISGFSFMNHSVNRDLVFVWSEKGNTLSDLWLALRLALANLLPGNLRGEVLGWDLTCPATKTWAVFQVIVTYILLTLLLLAIRRRFRR